MWKQTRCRWWQVLPIIIVFALLAKQCQASVWDSFWDEEDEGEKLEAHATPSQVPVPLLPSNEMGHPEGDSSTGGDNSPRVNTPIELDIHATNKVDRINKTVVSADSTSKDHGEKEGAVTTESIKKDSAVAGKGRENRRRELSRSRVTHIKDEEETKTRSTETKTRYTGRSEHERIDRIREERKVAPHELNPVFDETNGANQRTNDFEKRGAAFSPGTSQTSIEQHPRARSRRMASKNLEKLAEQQDRNSDEERKVDVRKTQRSGRVDSSAPSRRDQTSGIPEAASRENLHQTNGGGRSNLVDDRSEDSDLRHSSTEIPEGSSVSTQERNELRTGLQHHPKGSAESRGDYRKNIVSNGGRSTGQTSQGVKDSSSTAAIREAVVDEYLDRMRKRGLTLKKEPLPLAEVMEESEYTSHERLDFETQKPSRQHVGDIKIHKETVFVNDREHTSPGNRQTAGKPGHARAGSPAKIKDPSRRLTLNETRNLATVSRVDLSGTSGTQSEKYEGSLQSDHSFKPAAKLSEENQSHQGAYERKENMTSENFVQPGESGGKPVRGENLKWPTAADRRRIRQRRIREMRKLRGATLRKADVQRELSTDFEVDSKKFWGVEASKPKSFTADRQTNSQTLTDESYNRKVLPDDLKQTSWKFLSHFRNRKEARMRSQATASLKDNLLNINSVAASLAFVLSIHQEAEKKAGREIETDSAKILSETLSDMMDIEAMMVSVKIQTERKDAARISSQDSHGAIEDRGSQTNQLDNDLLQSTAKIIRSLELLAQKAKEIAQRSEGSRVSLLVFADTSFHDSIPQREGNDRTRAREAGDGILRAVQLLKDIQTDVRRLQITSE